MEEKAQTSMEALLLLALTVFAAAVVGLYLLGLPKSNFGPAINSKTNEIKNAFNNI